MLLHTVLENNDSEVMLKQTGLAQGSTMQIFNRMVIRRLITIVKETQVQSLLLVQLLSEMQPWPARESRESHMSCLQAHEVSKILIGHEVYVDHS